MTNMKAFYKSVLAIVALFVGFSMTSCEDANEYEDAMTDNPSWVENYNDSLKIAHPETLANTVWVRANGLKKNVYGDEIQGFVESLDFTYAADSVVVKMSAPVFPSTVDKSVITWTDESNTAKTPAYLYKYSNVTGKVEILKTIIDDKGKVSQTVIFTAVAVSEKQEVLTIAHYGDTPVQTYMVRK